MRGRARRWLQEVRMKTEDVLSSPTLSHGAYLCGWTENGVDARSLPGLAIPELVARLHLVNEFGGAPPASAPGWIAFVRGACVAAREIADKGLEQATWVVHVGSKEGDVVTEFLEQAGKLLAP